MYIGLYVAAVGGRYIDHLSGWELKRIVVHLLLDISTF